MWVFTILIAVAAIYFGAHDVALAQATTPNAAPPPLPSVPNTTPPFQGHDVVQLAGGKLSNPLRHSRAADDRRNRDLKRDRERCVRNGLHFEPAWMSDELLPAILPNWKIKRATVRFPWHTAHSPCRSPLPRRPGPSMNPGTRSSARTWLHRPRRRRAGPI